ncbi:GtrA family protein [Pseudokineococcus marinus]|uniref:GtrA family protein n=1 Tax=Pseudokineococcus marinus TaxID=351215 RepID=A0A849BRP0_9ACTN|nr:GtrA family protein [Pseudokineococcus marinus]NNH24195.1 GtrA family protein [Pseudokineococcus marinus]
MSGARSGTATGERTRDGQQPPEQEPRAQGAHPADEHGRGRSVPPARRVGRFGVVAGLNALVDLGVFAALVALRPSPGPQELAVLSAVAVVAALVHSYVWNSRWTFGDRRARSSLRARRAQRVRFAVQGAVNVALGAGVVWAAATVLDATTLPRGATDLLAKLVSMAVASTASYLLMHHLVFRGHRDPV